MQPEDCVGMLFLNKNNVLNILNNPEDIIKSHGYFGAIPQRLVLVEPDNEDKILVTESNIPKNYIQQFIEEYRIGKISNIEIEVDEIDGRLLDEILDEVDYKPIVRPKLTNGFVTIIDNKAEPVYTEKEVCDLLCRVLTAIINPHIPKPDLLEWFNNNKK